MKDGDGETPSIVEWICANLKAGDVVAVKESRREGAKIKALAETAPSKVKPKWLDFNAQDLAAKIVALPTREDIDFEFEEQLIVELYSK